MDNESILNALNESVDALGDIPAEDATEQQREAYSVCMEVRDEMIEED